MRKFGKSSTEGQHGFTIVELMIASAIFGVIIVITSSVIIGFTNNYRKGLIENTTQNVTRSILDTIANAIQFSTFHVSPEYPNEAATLSLPTTSYCISSTKYDFQLDKPLGSDSTAGEVPRVLTERQGSGNSCSGGAPTNPQELLAPHMRLAKFRIFLVPGTTDMYTVVVRVAYGDSVLMNRPANGNTTCLATAGSQFCAVRELRTIVRSRLY